MKQTRPLIPNRGAAVRCLAPTRQFCAATEGQSLVETALSLTMLLLCVISVIGLSEAAYAKHFTAAAARQGTRFAIVRGSTFATVSCSTSAYACQATAADIQKLIRSHVPAGLSAGAVTVAVLWPGLAASGLNCLTLSGTNSPGCDVQVTVSYTFHYSLPFLPKAVSTFQSTSTMVISQ